MRNFELCIVDDESEITESLRSRLMMTLEDLSPSLTISTFTELTAAKAHLETSTSFMILVLDHDFPAIDPNMSCGYDLAAWVKRSFWTRHFTPIIYFTGRESRSGFDERALALGIAAPDFFLSKSRGFSDELETLISGLHTRLCNFEDTLEEHGLEIAMTQFTSLGWEL